MINRIGGQYPVGQQDNGQQPRKNTGTQGQFGAALQQELDRQRAAQTMAQPASTQDVAFSKHAIARAEERGIEVTSDLIGRLNNSVERAQAKGATNILAFDTEQAFIINVPHGRVITTMSQEEMKENIFTNIDGAVLL